MQNQSDLILNRLTAMLLLTALALIVFIPAVSAFAGRQAAPAGMVFCPLSRKFQPLNPPKNRENNPFSDICAGKETKEFLFYAIVSKISLSNIFVDGENGFDNLAFDYLAHGESALKNLPNVPHFPSENLYKKIGSTAVGSSSEDDLTVRLQPLRFFIRSLAARPPTALLPNFYTPEIIHRSDEVSRRIAPRAPPVRS